MIPKLSILMYGPTLFECIEPPTMPLLSAYLGQPNYLANDPCREHRVKDEGYFVPLLHRIRLRVLMDRDGEAVEERRGP